MLAPEAEQDKQKPDAEMTVDPITPGGPSSLTSEEMDIQPPPYSPPSTPRSGDASQLSQIDVAITAVVYQADINTNQNQAAAVPMEI